MGDIHFSQGDGEVSFCGAIEMSGFLHLKCDIIRGGMAKYLTPMGPTPLHVRKLTLFLSFFTGQKNFLFYSFIVLCLRHTHTGQPYL